MQTQNTTKIKASITGFVTILIFGFLFWEHFHGGVTSHHILHNKNLPSISNWWSGLLLPILTWLLLTRIEKRLNTQNSGTHHTNNAMSQVILIFLSGLAFGVLLSVSFSYQYQPFLDNVLYILIVLSFFIPLYYSEFILGFILGMTYTFGAIIPTVFMIIFGSIGFITYRFLRPTILKLATRLANIFK